VSNNFLIGSIHSPSFKDAAGSLVMGLLLVLFSLDFENRPADWGFKGGGGPMSRKTKVVFKYFLRFVGAFLFVAGIFAVVSVIRLN
jgi:hypothetical protein